MCKLSLAYIGLGSNLSNPEAQIQAGLDALSILPQCQNLQSAPWYRSKSIGPGKQPDYINTVASLQTQLTPIALLKALQAIEDQQERQRNLRWGARTLDLDLLLYNNECYNSEELQLPHPEMVNRSFVLLPLYDLAPTLAFPDGSLLSKKIKDLDAKSLQLTYEKIE